MSITSERRIYTAQRNSRLTRLYHNGHYLLYIPSKHASTEERRGKQLARTGGTKGEGLCERSGHAPSTGCEISATVVNDSMLLVPQIQDWRS